MTLMIYGSYGYTGGLVVEEAVRRGLRPVLSGRDESRVGNLARIHDLPARPVSLGDASGLRESLEGVSVVLNCAGPFSRTAAPLVDACLATGTHYLDVTGEIEVFEALAARDAEARTAGIRIMPGVGFDVVPTDCLAAHLVRRLPSATHLELAIHFSDSTDASAISRGTATTMIENLHRGGCIREDGRLTPVPTAHATRVVDFGDGARTCVSIPWGDVSTAFHTTSIPNVMVLAVVGRWMRRGMILSRPLAPLLGLGPVQSFLKSRIQAAPPGPDARAREQGRTRIHGRARDGEGREVTSRLVGPEGYAFTVLTALAATGRVLEGSGDPGFFTPAGAFGPEFVLDPAITDHRPVERIDLE